MVANHSDRMVMLANHSYRMVMLANHSDLMVMLANHSDRMVMLAVEEKKFEITLAILLKACAAESKSKSADGLKRKEGDSFVVIFIQCSPCYHTSTEHTFSRFIKTMTLLVK